MGIIEAEEVTRMTNRLISGLPSTHPGELLREDILPALNKPKAMIARLLEVSRQTLYDILAEKQDITPAMALRIGKLTGTSPEMWLNMQQSYDLRRLAEKDAAVLARIPTLEPA
jgi:addiction module HigA family antidote